MNAAELKELYISKVNPFFVERQYQLISSDTKSIIFEADQSRIILGVTTGILDYNPKFLLTNGVYIAHKDIVRVLETIQNKLNLKPPLCKNCKTFATSYTSINNLNRVTYLPPIKTEEDLHNNIKEIQSYLESTLFPMLEKYEDLTELHKAINGEDFWETDWRKPFSLGGNFEYKRLIVARLADISDEEFDQVVEKQRAIILEKTKGEYGEDFKKVLEIQDELVRLLKA